MTSRRSKTETPFTAREMYELVADVETYPTFIPWCVALRVVGRKPGENGAEKLHADMIVAYKVFREKFRSEVDLDPAHKTIDAEYVDGPFEHLRTRWRFEDMPGGGSTVDFFIDFEFRNALLQTTARLVFEKAFARMADAFVARAYELHGETAPAQS